MYKLSSSCCCCCCRGPTYSSYFLPIGKHIDRTHDDLNTRATSASSQWSNSQMTQPDSLSQIVDHLAMAGEDGLDSGAEEEEEEGEGEGGGGEQYNKVLDMGWTRDCRENTPDQAQSSPTHTHYCCC